VLIHADYDIDWDDLCDQQDYADFQEERKCYIRPLVLGTARSRIEYLLHRKIDRILIFKKKFAQKLKELLETPFMKEYGIDVWLHGWNVSQKPNFVLTGRK
jgi:hypothetical protein